MRAVNRKHIQHKWREIPSLLLNVDVFIIIIVPCLPQSSLFLSSTDAHHHLRVKAKRWMDNGTHTPNRRTVTDEQHNTHTHTHRVEIVKTPIPTKFQTMSTMKNRYKKIAKGFLRFVGFIVCGFSFQWHTSRFNLYLNSIQFPPTNLSNCRAKETEMNA